MSHVALLKKMDEAFNTELEALSIEQLKARLADSLRVTVGGLRDAALCVRELERRGEDLAHLKLSLMKYLRLVAYGQTIPEVVVRFAGQPALLNTIVSLPLPDQERLAGGEPVVLVTTGPDGRLTNRMVDPRELKGKQVGQVFGRGFIRPESEQILLIDHEKKEASRAVPKSIGDLHIDKERGGVVIGRKFVPLADLVAAVKALRT